jgi:hypothetical protein
MVISGFLNNALVGQITIPNLGTGYTMVLGTPAFATIDRLLFDGTGGQGGFALDNLSLNTIPEPASLLLIATGLGALGLLRRRRERP